ncbi:MAG: hypothetical protein IT423_23565 [Pirellulaceae bacterium]|nr:hypothetical protein [Pirellulaceae bacterium]
MNTDGQTLIALLCVAAAAIELARRTHGWLRGSRQSACSSCPARASSPVVSLSSIQVSSSLASREPESRHSLVQSDARAPGN